MSKTVAVMGIDWAIAGTIVGAVIAILGIVYRMHVAALNTRIATLKDGLGLAKDDYARLENIFTKQIELLTAENAKLGSPTIANSIRSLSQANTELKTITGRLEATEAPDDARFMAGSDRSKTQITLK
jgi:hypothetical protein